MVWYDGHLDLACLMLEGRDLLQPLAQATGGPQPPSVVFSSLQHGHVRFANATIFTAPNFHTPFGYPREDGEFVHQLGMRQVHIYQAWETMRLVSIVRHPDDLESSQHRGIALVLLMEGADPIRTPAELDLWFDLGLRIIGLTWSLGTRYAGGNQHHGPLTSLGRELLTGMEAKGMIHDLSHLCDEAAWELLELTHGPVMASHSNSRTLLHNDDHRHLSDALIQAIAQRQGIIGLNLLSRFLIPEGRSRRATIDKTVDHVERISSLMGHRKGIALGSDMDGGFGADQLPEGIHQPSDLFLLCDALASRGWNDTELRDFTHNNWLQWMKKNLPRPTPHPSPLDPPT